MKRLRPWLLLLFLALPLGCMLRGARGVPLPAEATQALAEARGLWRTRPEGWREAARAAALRAAAAAPDWVAPERVLDDLLREGLLGHEALRRRHAALAEGETAAKRYLAARLEGRAGFADLERAARLDPNLAWAQHGRAFAQFSDRHPRAALQTVRRALALARDAHEFGTFSVAEARYLLGERGTAEARERIEEQLEDAEVAEPERTELEALLARAELEDEDPLVLERGFWRGVALFERGRLSAEEAEELAERLVACSSRVPHPAPIPVLLAALAGVPGVPSERARARFLAERGTRTFAAQAFERAYPFGVSESARRTRALEAGRAAEALAEFLAGLPRRIVTEHGEPREPRLATLVRAAAEAASDEGGLRFGEALLAAGWFREAEAWASGLAANNAPETPGALALLDGALAGQALLGNLRAVLDRVDEGRAAYRPGTEGELGTAEELDDLEELLMALQPYFERYHGEPLPHALADSPRLHFGPFAAVVHPGPFYSAADEGAGLGRAGEPVLGLASELARLGLFGIFGQAPGGGGPDGSLLRLVGGESIAGAHLGVPFAGWVAWCDGTELESRPGRAGASVSGAALHEGYWVDLERVRADWRRACALRQEFLGPRRAELTRALAERGALLAAAAPPGERARWFAPLGEGARVLLASLVEREAEPTLDEWLELTTLHEEGHLTDRTRFLPLWAKWPGVLGLLLRHGFTPRAVARALEYRAQLVALCCATDPRWVLSECLAAADEEGGVLAHGEAYRALLEDLLGVLERHAAEFPALDPRHYWIHQLHFLAAEDVRRLAHLLAERHGMIRHGSSAPARTPAAGR